MQELLDMQKKLDGMIAKNRDVDVTIPDLCRAIIHESAELEDEYSWKWWKTPKDVSIEKAREESIDILHFLLSVFNKLGMDEEEIKKIYTQKMSVNIKRQEDGY